MTCSQDFLRSHYSASKNLLEKFQHFTKKCKYLLCSIWVRTVAESKHHRVVQSDQRISIHFVIQRCFFLPFEQRVLRSVFPCWSLWSIWCYAPVKRLIHCWFEWRTRQTDRKLKVKQKVIFWLSSAVQFSFCAFVYIKSMLAFSIGICVKHLDYKFWRDWCRFLIVARFSL